MLSPGITISVPSGSSPYPSRPSSGSKTADDSSRRTACDGHPLPSSAYSLALNFVCGVIEPGLPEPDRAQHLHARRRAAEQPTLSPASPGPAACGTSQRPCTSSSRVLMPTISTLVADFTMPRSTRPVTTVPRPEIENTSSIGIRNGCQSDDPAAECTHQPLPSASRIAPGRCSVAVFKRSQAPSPYDRNIVAREIVARQKLANLKLNQLQKLIVVNLVNLVHEHTSAGTPT